VVLTTLGKRLCVVFTGAPVGKPLRQMHSLYTCKGITYPTKHRFYLYTSFTFSGKWVGIKKPTVRGWVCLTFYCLPLHHLMSDMSENKTIRKNPRNANRIGIIWKRKNRLCLFSQTPWRANLPPYFFHLGIEGRVDHRL